jgi:hypothetical protein
MASVYRTPENVKVMLAMMRRAQQLDKKAVSWTVDTAMG